MLFQTLRELWTRLTWLRKRRQLDADLKAELDRHLDLRARSNVAAGLDPVEARYAARRDFGNLTQFQQQSSVTWTFPSLEGASLGHRQECGDL